MSVLDGTEQAIGGMVESLVGRVSGMLGAGPGFGPGDIPRAILKQVQARTQAVGRRKLCPHQVQLFVPVAIDRVVGSLREAVCKEAASTVIRWAEREGHQLLAPVHVEWFVDELGPPERVTVNVSFGPVQERLGTDAGNVLAPVDVSLMDGPQNPAWGRLLGEDGAAFELRGDPLIGRGEPASLLLSDPTVSTRHARLVREASGRVFLEDLGSANGTWVNGQEVDRVVRLRHSDRVEFGDRVFRFEEVSAGTP